ncbi:MAG: hypothetical protein ABI461_07050 [Polyangiaceae bacterium]
MSGIGNVGATLGTIANAVERGLAKIDPNDDPDAEPLGLPALLALAAALTWSVWMFWHWKFQPMQDLGHHIGLTAIVADYNTKGSLYPALYDPPDPLNANSLLYFVVGYLGRLHVIGITNCVRLCMVSYLVGVPLANVYALRVFGRSPWAAVISVPFAFAHNMNFVAGFANLLFAGPFMVLAIPLFYRVLVKPTWKRAAWSALMFVLVFLAHAHIFLWTGALCFVLTLVFFIAAFFKRRADIKQRLIRAAVVAGVSLACVVPSLLLFYRWYQWSFGAEKDAGAITTTTSGWDNHFGAQFKTIDGLFHDFYTYALKTLVQMDDLELLWKIGVLMLVAIACSRLKKWARPPVMEVAFALTVASYFLMPEGIDSNPVVGSRQIGISLWLISPLFSPVPAKVSRAARYLVIAGILWLTKDSLRLWQDNLEIFERTEAAGLEYVLDAAPPRQHMHFVKVMTDTSTIFTWKPLWHVEKFYMADKLGQVADNPAIVSTSSIRYRVGVDPHRITYHSADWPKWEELWNNYELVLVHGWHPTEAQLDLAKFHAVRVRRSGNWELWRKHGPWETGDAQVDSGR